MRKGKIPLDAEFEQAIGIPDPARQEAVKKDKRHWTPKEKN